MVRRGDLLMTAAGSLGTSYQHDSDEPACFAGYLVRFRARRDVAAPRFIAYWTRSDHHLAQIERGAVRSTIDNFSASKFRAMSVPLPPLEEQRRIADFLDEQTARLDRLASEAASIAEVAKTRAVSSLAESVLSSSGAWRVEEDWRLAPVGAFYEISLGKMLNEERATGSRLRPYLRNVNVQWDSIDTGDLKEMHVEPREHARFGLRAGDLLICEGGQPGRAAIWDGRLSVIYFQKALHRARPRSGASEPRWLLHLLRLCVALSLFTDEGGTTIAHLTKEQLRSLRLPFPPVASQRTLVGRLDEMQADGRAAAGAATRITTLIEERKRALINACLTGEFDVSTASSRAAEAALSDLPRSG